MVLGPVWYLGFGLIFRSGADLIHQEGVGSRLGFWAAVSGFLDGPTFWAAMFFVQTPGLLCVHFGGFGSCNGK